MAKMDKNSRTALCSTYFIYVTSLHENALSPQRLHAQYFTFSLHILPGTVVPHTNHNRIVKSVYTRQQHY